MDNSTSTFVMTFLVLGQENVSLFLISQFSFNFKKTKYLFEVCFEAARNAVQQFSPHLISSDLRNSLNGIYGLPCTSHATSGSDFQQTSFLFLAVYLLLFLVLRQNPAFFILIVLQQVPLLSVVASQRVLCSQISCIMLSFSSKWSIYIDLTSPWSILPKSFWSVTNTACSAGLINCSLSPVLTRIINLRPISREQGIPKNSLLTLSFDSSG